MSYQVLARKWRPRKFSELVGQEHVRQALVNALDNDRLHHAYLFTGTRGVGKTTIARIFSKSLNCESGVSAEPCGECSSCVEIDEGRFIDLIEVDAASRTKVEDTRELLENVQYAPTRGRYKVYLIDEVHMLSTHSFNALLKTLEEPPPHVKFLLATTDPKKLPATVLSRCLQFNLKRMQMPLIVSHLEMLLKAESIENEHSALRLIAKAADGSMRDALSLLDQAIAFGAGKVNEPDVRTMLGSIDQGYVIEMLKALAEANAKEMLAITARLAQQSPDYHALLGDLLSYLQQIAIAQAAVDAVDENLDSREEVLALAKIIPEEDVQLFYQIGLIGRRDIGLSPDLRAGLDMVLLRMLAFRPVSEHDKPRAVTAATEITSVPALAKAKSENKAAPVSTAPTSTVPVDTSDWSSLVGELPLKGMLRELAMNCSMQAQDVGENEDVWSLTLDTAHTQLLSDARRARLQQELSTYLNKTVMLTITLTGSESVTPAKQKRQQASDRQAQAVAAIEDDPNIKAMKEAFGATVHTSTIRPVNPSE